MGLGGCYNIYIYIYIFLYIYIYIYIWKYHKETPHVVTFFFKQAKMWFFFSFFLYKVGEQPKGVGTTGGGWQRKGVGGWIWFKKCVHMYINAKMIAFETILGMGVEGIKECSGGGWIQVWYIWYLIYSKNFWICHNVLPAKQ
jgi:hypothetical protein